VLTPHLGYVTTRTMTHWSAGAIEDIEAWQRGASIRVLTPADGSCQPALVACQ
jgi:phosphoglycerate dehydrogenase-like enzyme